MRTGLRRLAATTLIALALIIAGSWGTTPQPATEAVTATR